MKYYVKKMCCGYRSNNYGENKELAFSFVRNHEDPKNKSIKFVKNWELSLTLPFT